MKLAILGSAPSSRLLAPFNDLNWSIWACSPPNYDLPRVDAWFELHSLKRKLKPQNKPYIDVLKAHQRVYINKDDPLSGEFPDAVDYPFEEMIEIYGPDFFSSSAAWMMAFALQQKPEKIGLWGLDMSTQEEYGHQRPGLKFFIREAEKQGVKIFAPPESDILAPMPLYALKEQEAEWWKRQTRIKELFGRVNELDALIKDKESEELMLKGALDNMRYIEQTFCPTRRK